MWKVPEVTRSWDPGYWRVPPPFSPQGCCDISHTLMHPGEQVVHSGVSVHTPQTAGPTGALRINLVFGI